MGKQRKDKGSYKEGVNNGKFRKIIVDGGIPAYIIVLIGVISAAMIFERMKALFLDYSIKSKEFMDQVKAFLLKNQVEEAITFCSANQKKPLAHVVKGVLERADRDEDSMYQGLDVALSEVMPGLGKRLGYLTMFANVSTLIGLFGTITGLIFAFAAISQADPAQKQTLLAEGISMAMNTTALGLGVAIPIMIAYAFLNSRQNKILEEITECSSKTIDLLKSRTYQPFSHSTVYNSQIRMLMSV